MIRSPRILASLLACCALLAACGGSVGPSSVVTDPLTITVQPAAAVIYPHVPITIAITGGTGSYIVVSDNQAVIPLTGGAVGHSLTVVANTVPADTVVNLSVRDTGTTPQKAIVLTVRPETIANSITVTPSSTECAPAICSGQEALITATISQNGIQLPARGVRFDVISGDVRFITTPAGTSPEVLATSTTTVSDQLGLARVRLRVLPGAANQTALIQITDPETQAFQRVAITIRQAPGPGTGGAAFFVVPETVTFTGPFANTCASNPSASLQVFGGTPPYNVVPSSPLFGGGVVGSGTPVTISSSGSTCYANIPVTVTDAAGRTVVATFTNQAGTGTAPPAAITLSPAALTICRGQTGSVAISGGTVPFSAGTSHPELGVPTVAVRTVSITRSAMGAANSPASAELSVTDGTSVGRATIATPLPGAGGCP